MSVGPSLALQVSVLILYSISFVASLVGNTLVLYIIYKKPYTRKTTTYLFVNMVVADLIITVVAMPEGAAFYVRSDRWLGGIEGDILCRIYHFVFTLAIAASILTLAAMTLDRFIAVVYPLRAPKPHAARSSTIAIWLISTILMFHRLLAYSNSSGDCKSDWSRLLIENSIGKTIANILYLVLLFILPLFLVAVLNSVMCAKLRRQEIPGIINGENLCRRQNRNRKVVRLLIWIVVVFILCWLPVQAMHILWALNKAVPLYAMFLCFWCGHSYSAITPWMYIYLNNKFRGAFSEITGKLRNRVMSARNERMKSSTICRRSGARPVIAHTHETPL